MLGVHFVLGVIPTRHCQEKSQRFCGIGLLLQGSCRLLLLAFGVVGGGGLGLKPKLLLGGVAAGKRKGLSRWGKARSIGC
jgi:hypothetical protein